MVQWMLAICASHRVALGIRSVALVLFGVICFLDPSDLFRGDDVPTMRWMVPFGITLVVWAIALFPAELHGDLTEIKNSHYSEETLVGRPLWKTILYRWFQVWQGILLVINVTCIYECNSSAVGHQTNGDPTRLAVLSDGFTVVDQPTGAVLYTGIWGPSLCFLIKFLWSLAHLAHRLEKYPYSKSRTIYIVYTFTFLVILVAVFCFLVLIILSLYRSQASGPWSTLNSFMAMQVLPSPANQFTPEQVVLCLAAFIIIVGLGGASSWTLHLQSLREDDLDRTMLDMECTPANSHIVESRSAYPVFLGGGMTLPTVRLMCHCAHVTYKTKRGKELTEQHLQTGLPRVEDDMDYSSLTLHKVIRREGASDRDLMVFVASAPNSLRTNSVRDGGSPREQGRVCIVSFRGTATKKNILTDFDFQMEALKLPHLADAPEWSKCLVHRGFQTAFLTIYDELFEAISEINCCSFYFTGHSMGGAFATLLAAEFYATSSVPVSLCTFGTPRMGNDCFAELIKSTGIASVRVVCERDPVTQQPPRHWWLRVLPQCQSRIYSHIHGLSRVSDAGRLVVMPNFLEETLRSLHQITNLTTSALKCICCRTSKNHKIRAYVAALHAAQAVEICSAPTTSGLELSGADLVDNDSDSD